MRKHLNFEATNFFNLVEKKPRFPGGLRLTTGSGVDTTGAAYASIN